MDAKRIQEMAAEFGDRSGALPYYLMAIGQQAFDTAPAERNQMSFGTHFNPKLAMHSTYFANVKSMMECVEHNQEAVAANPALADKVCAKEFKSMQMSAFNDELLFHQINKRFFMAQLAYKNRESPF